MRLRAISAIFAFALSAAATDAAAQDTVAQVTAAHDTPAQYRVRFSKLSREDPKFPQIRESDLPQSGDSDALTRRANELFPFPMQFSWAAAGNFDGVQVDDLFCSSPQRQAVDMFCERVVRGEEPPRIISWAQLPRSFRQAAITSGDLNGDGRADVLALGKEFGGWWIIWSAKDSRGNLNGFETPVAGLPIRIPQATALLLRDVNGDNRSDVVLFDRDTKFYQVFLTELDQSDPNQSQFGRPYHLPNDDPGPYICLGYMPGTKPKWGFLRGSSCPDGYAFYGAQELGRPNHNPEESVILGTCCRLPNPDILLSERSSASGSCPENFVAVGAESYNQVAGVINRMQCQRINTERYQLGPRSGGQYWGVGASMPRFQRTLSESEIPTAIRYGVSRSSLDGYSSEGCLGKPIGSLVVGKAKGCSEQLYQELQYRGLAGDPPAGTPVKMFPDCQQISDLHDPQSGCKR